MRKKPHLRIRLSLPWTMKRRVCDLTDQALAPINTSIVHVVIGIAHRSLLRGKITDMKNTIYLSRVKPRNQVQKTDAEIDQLVYKLYNLTPEEIKIIEGVNAI